MNIERTIEFMLKNQARMDARFDAKFDRADERFAQAEKRFAHIEKRFAQNEQRSMRVEKRLDRLERLVAQNNRIVTRLTRYGVSLRSDVRRTERNLAKVSEGLSDLEATFATRSEETDDKLNALIDLVDRHLRGNGRHK